MADENKNISTDTFKMPMLKGVGDAAAPGTPLPGSAVADDTRTRRTVRLNAIRPAGVGSELRPMPSGNVVSTDSGVISDPLAGRGTDSGVIAGVSRPNIKVKPIGDNGNSIKPGALDDTRTRKTVQLASLAPQVKSREEASAGAVTLQSVRPGDVDDTIRLQRHEAPAMPGGIGAATIPSPGISIAKPEAKQADSTHTQAIARATPLAAASEIVLPAPEAVTPPSMDTNTQSLAAVNVAKSTIKLKTQPAPEAAAPAAAAPAAEAAPAAAAPAVNLVRTPVKESTSARKPAAAAAPAATPAAKKAAPVIKKEEEVAKPAAAAAPAPAAVVPMVRKSAVSPVFTCVAVVVFLAMVFAAVLTVVQCINAWHLDWVGGEPIQIPLISGSVK